MHELSDREGVVDNLGPLRHLPRQINVTHPDASPLETRTICGGLVQPRYWKS